MLASIFLCQLWDMPWDVVYILKWNWLEHLMCLCISHIVQCAFTYTVSINRTIWRDIILLSNDTIEHSLYYTTSFTSVVHKFIVYVTWTNNDVNHNDDSIVIRSLLNGTSIASKVMSCESARTFNCIEYIPTIFYIFYAQISMNHRREVF